MNGEKGEYKIVHGVKTEKLFRIKMDGINEYLWLKDFEWKSTAQNIKWTMKMDPTSGLFV